jgi:hypothetical protein
MSVSANLQKAIGQMLSAPGALRVNAPILSLQPKELIGDIEAAATRIGGLGINTLPVLPTRITDDAPFVFVEEGNLIVRTIETPAMNSLGASAWQLAEDIANALQWQPRAPQSPLSALLAHPLQLAPECFREVSDSRFRIVDTIFNATYQLPARSLNLSSFVPDEGKSASDNLQEAMRQLLSGGMINRVPVTVLKDHDLGSQIENAGNTLFAQVQPPRPARSMQGVDCVFIEAWECAVKIIEQTATNPLDVNAYDICEDAMTTLHWADFGRFLAHPLQLQPTPTRMGENESPTQREIEILFTATLGFLPTE